MDFKTEFVDEEFSACIEEYNSEDSYESANEVIISETSDDYIHLEDILTTYDLNLIELFLTNYAMIRAEMDIQ